MSARKFMVLNWNSAQPICKKSKPRYIVSMASVARTDYVVGTAGESLAPAKSSKAHFGSLHLKEIRKRWWFLGIITAIV
jgi:hypothetical protein